MPQDKGEMQLMTSKLTYLWIIMGTLLFLFPAHAEFYKYQDENGVTRFTNDLANVPEDQRAGIEAYDEVVSDQDNVVYYQEEGVSSDEIENDVSVEEGAPKDLAEFIDMNKKKAALDKEYVALVREREALIQMKENITTKQMLEEYTNRFEDLNNRISQYEGRRQAFSKEVEAFNQGVSKKASAVDTENPPSEEIEE